jgi:hypothetical protein
MRKEREEELKKIREEREARMRKEREEKEEWEAENKHLLNISYADKDKYKLEFKTRWDPEIKKWYWIGLIADMPEKLKSKLIK